MPGLGRLRCHSATSAAPRVGAEVLIGSRPRHGRREDGWGSVERRTAVSRDPIRRASSRHAITADDDDDERRRRFFSPSFSYLLFLFFFFLPSLPFFRSPDSLPVSLRFNRFETAYPIHFFPSNFLRCEIIGLYLYVLSFLSLSLSLTC